MSTAPFPRRIRLATSAVPAAVCTYAAWLVAGSPASASIIDRGSTLIALAVLLLVGGLVLWHVDDFAPRVCARCSQRLSLLEIPFTRREGLERLRVAVDAGEMHAVAALAEAPLPPGDEASWVCVAVESCSRCEDRARLRLLDLSGETLLAGPTVVSRSPLALLGAGARRRERAQPRVGVRLRG